MWHPGSPEDSFEFFPTKNTDFLPIWYEKGPSGLKRIDLTLFWHFTDGFERDEARNERFQGSGVILSTLIISS